MKKENSNHHHYILLCIFLIALVFILAVVYKFISTNIQEEKESNIIQEKLDAKKEETANTPHKVSVLPDKVIGADFDSGMCKIQNEIDSASAWTSACYLQNKLTTQCKDIFDSKGYFVVSVTGDAIAYVNTSTYLNNSDICKCNLPIDLASRLNEAQQHKEGQCNKLASIDDKPFK